MASSSSSSSSSMSSASRLLFLLFTAALSAMPTSSVTDRLYSGDGLRSDGFLTSGLYILRMQIDCNLVLRNANSGREVWSSGTTGMGNRCMLRMRDDGNFAIHNGFSLKPIWVNREVQSTKDTYVLILKADGNLIVHDKNKNVIWSIRPTN